MLKMLSVQGTGEVSIWQWLTWRKTSGVVGKGGAPSLRCLSLYTSSVCCRRPHHVHPQSLPIVAASTANNQSVRTTKHDLRPEEPTESGA